MRLRITVFLFILYFNSNMYMDAQLVSGKLTLATFTFHRVKVTALPLNSANHRHYCSVSGRCQLASGCLRTCLQLPALHLGRPPICFYYMQRSYHKDHFGGLMAGPHFDYSKIKIIFSFVEFCVFFHW